MITPEKMSQLEQNKVVEMYTELNQNLTADIIKRIQKTGDISSFTRSQIKVLIRQGGKDMFYSALKRINGLSRAQKKAIEQLYQEILITEYDGYKSQYTKIGKDFEISKTTLGIVNTMLKTTNREMKNLTKTIAFASQQKYVEAMDELYKQVASGSFDYQSAMKKTINKLVQEGVTLESKGRNYKLESAVKSNLMTSLTQTANDISKEVGKEIGADSVWIAPSPFCRPSHRVINGVKMSKKEFKKYEYLTHEPNCYHVVNYVIGDLFEEPYTKEELKKINTNADKVYETRQKQNYYARQVRNKKEEVATLSKSDKRNNATNEELIKAKKELRNAQMKFRQYSKSNGLEVDYTLSWKAGYNK